MNKILSEIDILQYSINNLKNLNIDEYTEQEICLVFKYIDNIKIQINSFEELLIKQNKQDKIIYNDDLSLGEILKLYKKELRE